MLLLVGYVIVLAASVGTYAVHGSLGALWVPLEYLAIIGLTVGYLVASNGPRSLKAVLGAIPGVLKGSPFNKALYMDLLALLFEILAKVRKEGLMSIEGDVENPEASPIFSKYPSVLKDHHVVEFITDYLRMMVGGNLNAFEIENLMDIEIETHHAEAHFPAHMVQSLAGAIPAMGIVVAVMGVVNVMGSVGSPPAVLGKMIGGALVGTFLGILLSYGFVEPIANQLNQKVDEGSKIYQCIKAVLLASMNGYAPHSKTADTLWRTKICEKACIEDLHFHDSRHEACTRMASKLDLLELAEVMGIVDLKTLKEVYYNPKVEDLYARLNT